MTSQDKLQKCDLHPEIHKILDQATEGLDLLEAARLQQIMISSLENVSFCGITTPRQVMQLCVEVLKRGVQRIEARLLDLCREEI